MNSETKPEFPLKTEFIKNEYINNLMESQNNQIKCKTLEPDSLVISLTKTKNIKLS